MEYSDELMHYGVPGMKWGVRRYRAYSSTSKTRTSKKTNKQPVKNTTPKKKKTSELSDAELREKVNRLNLEKQYRDLANNLNPPKKHAFKEYTVGILKDIGKRAMTDVGSQLVTNLAGKAINKAFKDDVINLKKDKNKDKDKDKDD